jgi:hypothetical protein
MKAFSVKVCFPDPAPKVNNLDKIYYFAVRSTPLNKGCINDKTGRIEIFDTYRRYQTEYDI